MSTVKYLAYNFVKATWEEHSLSQGASSVTAISTEEAINLYHKEDIYIEMTDVQIGMLPMQADIRFMLPA